VRSPCGVAIPLPIQRRLMFGRNGKRV
jgi:hypothetical protein